VREDRDLRGGAPDKLCLLPAGHESRWRIGGALRMFHLYVDPEELAHQAVTAFDVDPRRIQLHDATFCDDAALAAVVRGAVMPLDWTEPGDRSALDAACRLLLHGVLRWHIDKDPGEVRAGLSPAARRRVMEMVEMHLDEARLSTFHFAKMFRISFGMPPHRYLAARRIERAKSLLRTGQPLDEVALACGYGSQSHFNRAF
jgi:AraC family transcriptional regulator